MKKMRGFALVLGCFWMASFFVVNPVCSEEQPKDASFYLTEGVELSHKEEWDLAIGSFKKAAALDPANGLVQMNLSLVYAEKRDFNNAVKTGELAVKLLPKKGTA